MIRFDKIFNFCYTVNELNTIIVAGGAARTAEMIPLRPDSVNDRRREADLFLVTLHIFRRFFYGFTDFF